jgi:hypothetical protein
MGAAVGEGSRGIIEGWRRHEILIGGEFDAAEGSSMTWWTYELEIVPNSML